jgi:hypothetical protein
MLGVSFGDVAYGKIKVDFARDVSALSELAKPNLLTVLQERGLMIDDLNSWTAKAQGKLVTLEGELSESGLRLVSSLISPPTPALGGAEKEPSAEAAADATAKATQAHFRAVNELLEDLRGKRGQAKTVGQIGVWFDNYARRVDRLPMVNVDKEMLDYSRYVSQQLRNSAMAIKGIGIRSGVRQAQETTQGVSTPYASGGGYDNYRYGRYGWYAGVESRGMNRYEQAQTGARIRMEERGTGAAQARSIMQDIENVTAQVRRTMTEKYNLEF